MASALESLAGVGLSVGVAVDSLDVVVSDEADELSPGVAVESLDEEDSV